MNLDPTLPVPQKPRLSWRAPGGCGRLSLLVVLALLFLQAAPARADIWGFVDANSTPHFAASKLDDRYELFLRNSDFVEPFGQTSVAGSRPAGGAATVAARPAGPPVPARLVAFFEQSKNYKAVSPLLHEASKTHGIDYSLLKALIVTESGFNPSAVSPKGAVGLMQLIPPTAQRYGVTAGKGVTIEEKLTDPKTNIKAGARYLADLIKRFPGRLELALAAYNAGEGAVQRAGNKIPNYPETQNYVKTVMQLYTGLSPAVASLPAPFKAQTGRVRVEIRGGSSSSSARNNLPPQTESLPVLLRLDTPQN